MDHGAVANGHSRASPFFDDPSLHDGFGGGELGAVIDANQRAGVGGEADGAALFGGEGDDIGEIQLALCVVRIDLGQGFFEKVDVGAVHAGVDFTDGSLGVIVEVPMFANFADTPIFIAKDSSIARGIVDGAGEHGEGGIGV